MTQIISFITTPEEGSDVKLIQKKAAQELQVKEEEIVGFKVIKKSIDARKKKIKIQIRAEVSLTDKIAETKIVRDYQDVTNAEEVIVVGSGPAGLFAALKLIQQGKRPIILERGKEVQERRRDIADINKKHIVNENSNYCFGEGGAGTYSDGKLYTRSKKRGSIIDVLETLVFHGANEEILIDAHPHIGTNKLPKIITNMKETVVNCGGVVKFNTKVVDFIIDKEVMKGVITESGDKILAKSTILATGHSARDIFFLLDKKKVRMEYKPFAMGVRVEHPQALIDQIQYSCKVRGEHLPAASYRLVDQIEGRGVYSFCMCPGGFIVPAATTKGEIVVNGMSPSKRNSQYANSGIVVEIKDEDLLEYQDKGALKGLHYQMALEKKACEMTQELQIAPGQRMVDFVNEKKSPQLNSTSYQPGILSTQMSEILPGQISNALKGGFQSFGKKMKGYYTNQANIIGVESRTSSPVMIPRKLETLQHIQIKNLYPCGEGAGYAGGIISAAIDGEKCALAIL